MAAFGTQKRALLLWGHAQEKGLEPLTAWLYVLLAWNYERLAGESAPRITSGRRSRAHQLSLRQRWDAGDRRGLVVRPALSSQHTEGRAFDIERKRRAIAAFASWAPGVGLRWGGNFSDPDPVHFDTKNLGSF